MRDLGNVVSHQIRSFYQEGLGAVPGNAGVWQGSTVFGLLTNISGAGVLSGPLVQLHLTFRVWVFVIDGVCSCFTHHIQIGVISIPWLGYLGSDYGHGRNVSWETGDSANFLSSLKRDLRHLVRAENPQLWKMRTVFSVGMRSPSDRSGRPEVVARCGRTAYPSFRFRSIKSCCKDAQLSRLAAPCADVGPSGGCARVCEGVRGSRGTAVLSLTPSTRLFCRTYRTEL